VEDLVPHGRPAETATPPVLDLDALVAGTKEARVEDIAGSPPTIDIGLAPPPGLELPDLTLEETAPVAPPERPPVVEAPAAPPEAFDITAVVAPATAPPAAAPPPAPAAAAPSPPAATAASAAETVTVAPAASATPATPAVAVADGFYYRQDFDDEVPGSPPRNWTGEYDYATLTVDSENAVAGSKACLKFEKKTGAGSANYVCSFPKASGRVIVEFDIRCDEKNKYLLGLYIERDEDFKQSVHTIIHRLDSKSQPSLRLQGEPVPYELGTWRHVKYDLNLLAGIVSAYVDGQPVVKEVKLPTIPPYVNTLSIRDNLATTGVFYLDNIMIYKG
jgi:hypothetical protein